MERVLTTSLGIIFVWAGVSKVLRQQQTGGGPPRWRSSPRVWAVVGLLETQLGLLLVFAPSGVVLVVAGVFLVAATVYLGTRLALLDREACNCFGAQTTPRRQLRPGTVSIRNAARPAWYFARNGVLLILAAIALESEVAPAALTIASAWLLLALGTLVSIGRLRQLRNELTAALTTPR